MSNTVAFETSIPRDVYVTLQAQGFFREQLAEHVQQLLALQFFQSHVLSLGQAAQLAQMDRWSFIEYLAENQVPVIDLSDEELADELRAVEALNQSFDEAV